ncbi:MAG: 50S ribosomal protein L11 methyltransferase [Firmicutes bacterium]|nr:50S ribosomal protein L11 methyltransferase [Bacillota bacterium]
MQWIEGKITTTSQAVELVIGFLMVHDVNNVRIVDDEEVSRFLLDHPLNWDYKDDEILNRPGAEIIFHVQADEAGEQILANISSDLPKLPQNIPEVDFGKLNFTFGDVNDDDWLNEWKKTYKPFNIGKNIKVVPVWEEYAQTNEIIFKIDPGAVFGTGLHETTQLCVETLENMNLKNKTILDIGCGSGILSIISMLLGANKAVACDIDPSAESCAENNALLNKVDNYEVKIGNIFDENFLSQILKNAENFENAENAEKTPKFDIAIANIVADVIIGLSDLAEKFVKKGGFFLVSGIIAERLEEVSQAIIANNLTIIQKLEKNGWVCLLLEV